MSTHAPAQADGLSDQATLDFSIGILRRSFGLAVQGYRCQTDDVYRVAVHAAAASNTIESSCQQLSDVPHSNTVRGHLNRYLQPLPVPELERLCNRALARCWPHWLWQQELEVAVDLHDECYYGEFDPQSPDNWVCNAQKRDGTRHFYRCASLCIVHQAVRLTLAVVFVPPKMALVELLKKLLFYARARGLHLWRLYADKGFWSVPVIRYLQRQPMLSAIVAVPRRGKRGGIRGLCHGRSSYRTLYHFYSWRFGAVDLSLGLVRAYKKHHAQRQATWVVYALIRVSESLARVRQLYRSRFGIDTGYRLMEQVRARTTSRLPALRFFWMGLALILVNCWVALRWTRLRLAGSGPRRLATDAFSLTLLTVFVRQSIARLYGARTTIQAIQANL